jgi:hypothetical protein
MATALANLRAKLNGELGVATDTETVPWTQAVRHAAIADGYGALYRQGVWKDAKQDLASVTDQYSYALTSIRSLNRIEVIDSYGTVVPGLGRVQPDGAGGLQLVLRSPIAAGFTIRVWGWAPYSASFSATATVTSSSVANPTVITTGAAHGFTTGDTVTIASHAGSTPLLNGDHVLTVTAPTTFTVPVNVTIGGTGGTATCLYASAVADDLAAEYNRVPLLKAKAILYRQQLGLFARYGERQALPPEMNLTIDQLLGIIAACEREFADECDRLSGQRPRVGRSRRTQ